MSSMPVFHKTEAPEGMMIDTSLWNDYREKGFVDSPQKMTPRKVFSVPDISHLPDVKEPDKCSRCGRERHKGFCKKVTNGENSQSA